MPCHVHARLVLVAVAWMTGVAPEADAVIFVGENPVVHNRFLGDLTVNPAFLIDHSLISGISGGQTSEPTTEYHRAHLISPLHFISTDHTGTPEVIFRKSDGTLQDYPVLRGPSRFVQLTTQLPDGTTRPSDIRLYRLQDPIPAEHGITPMTIYGGKLASLVGQEIYVMGKDNQAGRNVIKGVELIEDADGRHTFGTKFTFDTDANGGTDGLGDDEVRVESGDSGHANLLRLGTGVALLGYQRREAEPGAGKRRSSYQPRFGIGAVPGGDRIDRPR